MPKPTPTAVLEARGSKLNTTRMAARAKTELKPTAPVGSPPAYFDEAQRSAWQDILGTCVEGVLYQSDQVALEVASVLLATVRSGEYAAHHVSQLHAYLANFGMTPVDRIKVGASVRAEEKPANPFAALAKPAPRKSK